MTHTIEVSGKVQVVHGANGRRLLVEGQRPSTRTLPVGRVPRIARLLALAIRLEELVRTDIVRDYAELARLGQVSPARISQIVGLNLLAPDIQEEILFLRPTLRGRDPLREQHVRPITAVLHWRTQRRMWRTLKRHVALAPGPATCVAQTCRDRPS